MGPGPHPAAPSQDHGPAPRSPGSRRPPPASPGPPRRSAGPAVPESGAFWRGSNNHPAPQSHSPGIFLCGLGAGGWGGSENQKLFFLSAPNGPGNSSLRRLPPAAKPRPGARGDPGARTIGRAQSNLPRCSGPSGPQASVHLHLQAGPPKAPHLPWLPPHPTQRPHSEAKPGTISDAGCGAAEQATHTGRRCPRRVDLFHVAHVSSFPKSALFECLRSPPTKGRWVGSTFLTAKCAECLLIFFFLVVPPVTTKRLGRFAFCEYHLKSLYLMPRVLHVLFAEYFVFDLIYHRRHNVLSEYIFAQLISFFIFIRRAFAL